MYNNIILTRRFITSSYSCLFYLEHELFKFNTDLWAFGDTSKIGDKYKNGFHSFNNDTWYGKIPRLRLLFSNIHAFLLMLSTKNTIIINDLDFFIEAYYVKKIKKNIKIIHYNTELPGKDVPYSNRIMKFYKKHADFPDMIIDCLEERASYRKKKWNINKKIWIINNTIPNDTIPRTIDKSLFTYTSFNNNFPILIYAGRCSDNEVIDALVNSMNNCNGINFLFFCHGEKKYKDKLINRCQSHIEAGICKIYDSISREKLLMIMQHCNIGVSFYDPNYSMNYRYASPSKIFEYIACGLQVISTNNEGINHLIINNRIGVCINENEKFENALNRLITSNLLDNYNIKKLFEDSLSYEHLSKNTINEIIKLIKA